MRWLLYILFGDTGDRAWYPRRLGDVHFDAYYDWWIANAPFWNRYNQHDYNIGLVAWMDARAYWQGVEVNG